MMNKTFFPFLIVLIVLIFFWQFLVKGLLPIPADTIIGLYHPFRDLYSKEYPNGIPFKNFLITDPVRQQYPWRELSINALKKFELPLWNPYAFAGTPLMANFQSAVFYPFNILFLIFSFNTAWSILILTQPLLAGVFLYFYLDNLKLNRLASLLGFCVFSFSGFFIVWLEWGTMGHVGLWLPLILLSIDKLFYHEQYFHLQSSCNDRQASIQIKNKKLLIWSFIFILSLMFSFFAGHLQIFFYVFIFSFLYLFMRWIQFGKNFKFSILFFILYFLFFILTFIQWFPTLQFILESARGIDQNWKAEGWFIPWQHLLQLLIPDFFGNPATLNYWGVWNYGEVVGYVGILPFLMAIFSIFFRHDKKTLFFGGIFFLSLLFSLPTIFAKIPFILNIPFFSTAQPTRLLFIIDFSLAVLSALGFDLFIQKKRGFIYPIAFFAFVFIGLWFFILYGNSLFKIISFDNLLVSKNNMIFPTVIFITILFLISINLILKEKKTNFFLLLLLLFITVFDLFRFGFKFIPFSPKNYLFPQTPTITFLQNQREQFRIMTMDPRILPPNVLMIYHLQSIEGYDPLYLRRYGELMAASERGKPDISVPFGFNRIVEPKNYDSKIIDLLGVKYILSLSEIQNKKFVKVFQEGKTITYENKNYLPRSFFVKQVNFAGNKNEVIQKIFEKDSNLKEKAIVENLNFVPELTVGKAKIVYYSKNKIIINTENLGNGFLVLTDIFYPTWHVKIDNVETKIYMTDYIFRGILVPKGKHRIEFSINII